MKNKAETKAARKVEKRLKNKRKELSKNLAVVEPVSELEMRERQTSPLLARWNTEQFIEQVRKVVNDELTPDQCRLYFFECARRGVHPLDKALYPVVRDGKLAIQASIDYLRSVAMKTGEYAGTKIESLEWLDEAKGELKAATVTVRRKLQGEIVSFTVRARTASFIGMTKQGKVNSIWQKMPDVMTAKCAESGALRQAFPEHLGGIYSHEEMEQAGNVRVVSPAAKSAPVEVSAADTLVFTAGNGVKRTEVVGKDEIGMVRSAVVERITALKDAMSADEVQANAKKIIEACGAPMGLASLEKSRVAEVVEAISKIGIQGGK